MNKYKNSIPACRGWKTHLSCQSMQQLNIVSCLRWQRSHFLWLGHSGLDFVWLSNFAIDILWLKHCCIDLLWLRHSNIGFLILGKSVIDFLWQEQSGFNFLWLENSAIGSLWMDTQVFLKLKTSLHMSLLDNIMKTTITNSPLPSLNTRSFAISRY